MQLTIGIFQEQYLKDIVICDAIIKFIPIIYGSLGRERKSLEIAQNEGKLIIANLDCNAIKEGVKIPLYGCKICKTSLPRYGTMP